MPLTRREQELRERARALIAEGRLPALRSEEFWGGKGRRKLCSLCAEPVDPHEVELEVADPAGRLYHFHYECHAAWQLECERADGSRRGRR